MAFRTCVSFIYLYLPPLMQVVSTTDILLSYWWNVIDERIERKTEGKTIWNKNSFEVVVLYANARYERNFKTQSGYFLLSGLLKNTEKTKFCQNFLPKMRTVNKVSCVCVIQSRHTYQGRNPNPFPSSNCNAKTGYWIRNGPFRITVRN